MARAKVVWCVGAMLCSLAAVTLGEDKAEIGATGDFFSRYVWRGQNVVNNWVFQPGASVGYKGLTASVWSNVDLRGEVVGKGSLTETDLTLDYANKLPWWETLGYSVGTIYYSFLNTHTHPTAEAYGGLNLEVPLAPAVRWYYDYGQIKGSYIQFSIGHTIEKLHQWADDCYCGLQVGASVGLGTSEYNEGYFGVDRAAWNDLTLTAGLPLCLGKLTVRPSIGYSRMLNQDIRSSPTIAGHGDNFWGGVGFAYSF